MATAADYITDDLAYMSINYQIQDHTIPIQKAIPLSVPIGCPQTLHLRVLHKILPFTIGLFLCQTGEPPGLTHKGEHRMGQALSILGLGKKQALEHLQPVWPT